MRFPTAISAGVLTFALVLAACTGDQPPTAPDPAPSFSSLSSGTQYRVTFTCNAPATNNSLVEVLYYQGSTIVMSSPLACTGGQVFVGGFDNFTYDITTVDNDFNLVRECVQRQAVTRTGRFSCNRSGLTAAVTVQAQ